MVEWNVYTYNINTRKLESYNIFEHSSFLKSIKDIIKRSQDKLHFETALKTELAYYFWGKAEWEIIISPWLATSKPDRVKVDVFDQIMLNWNVFVNHVWENRKEISKL